MNPVPPASGAPPPPSPPPAAAAGLRAAAAAADLPALLQVAAVLRDAAALERLDPAPARSELSPRDWALAGVLETLVNNPSPNARQIFWEACAQPALRADPGRTELLVRALGRLRDWEPPAREVVTAAFAPEGVLRSVAFEVLWTSRSPMALEMLEEYLASAGSEAAERAWVVALGWPAYRDDPAVAFLALRLWRREDAPAASRWQVAAAALALPDETSTPPLVVSRPVPRPESLGDDARHALQLLAVRIRADETAPAGLHAVAAAFLRRAPLPEP